LYTQENDSMIVSSVMAAANEIIILEKKPN
jgi:hypothetical protein